MTHGKKEIGQYTVNVINDCDSESPREWCNLGTFYTDLSRYNSPDEMSQNELKDSLAYDLNAYLENGEISTRKMHEKAIILPVYVYEHGAIAYQASDQGNPFPCGWDSGQAGYIFITLEKVRKEYGVKRITAKLRDRVINYLKSEVDTYSSWANGEVYGYDVENNQGDSVESCWGFIGEPELAMNEGINAAKYEIANDAKERKNTLKTLIKNHVPLIQRAAILNNTQICHCKALNA